MAMTHENYLTWDLNWFALRGSNEDIGLAEEVLRDALGSTAADGIEVVRMSPDASEIRYSRWYARLSKETLKRLLAQLPNLKLRGVAQDKYSGYEEVYSRAGSPNWERIWHPESYLSAELPHYWWWDKDGTFSLSLNADGTYCITGLNSWDEEVEIPSEIDGRVVTSIGTGAFFRNTHIRRLVIPGSVTSIGKGAFDGCSNLVVQATSPDIGEMLEEAGVNVVSGDESEEDLAIKVDYGYRKTRDGVVITRYRGEAREVAIPELIEGQPVVGIDKKAFGYRMDEDWKLSKVVVPPSVTRIGANAFSSSGVAELVFAEGSKIEFIGNCAFAACDMRRLSLPDGLRRIGDGAFSECFELESVRIPASVEHIGSWAFGGEGPFAHFERIEVDEGNAVYASLDGALYSKDLSRVIRVPALACGTYSVPESVVEIGACAFEACNVSRVRIPASVQSIGEYAFLCCEKLQEVTFAENSALVEIGCCAFDYAVVLPNGVRRLADVPYPGACMER